MRSEEIYEALFDEDAFNNLPALFAGLVGAKSALINWVHSDGEYANLAYHNFSKHFIADYAAGFVDKDLWVHAAMGRKNRIIDVEHYVPVAVFEKSEIYNELVRPHADDTIHCIGGAFATQWGSGVLGVHRSRKAEPFEADALKLLESHASVLRRVLAVRGEIGAHRRSAALAKSALDIVGLAAIVVNSDRRVVHANAQGEAVLRRDDRLRLRGGILAARGEADAQLLTSIVFAAAHPAQPRSGTLTLKRGAREAYYIAATPIPCAGRARVLLTFRDPDLREPLLVERVQLLFRLTRAEAELAVALAEGGTLAEIAERRQVQPSTIRTQFKALAIKMNCHRQSEIVAIIARLPPLQSVR